MPGFPFVPRGFVIIFSQSRYSARLTNNTEWFCFVFDARLKLRQKTTTERWFCQSQKSWFSCGCKTSSHSVLLLLLLSLAGLLTSFPDSKVMLTASQPHSEHRFPSPSSMEGCRKPVLAVCVASCWGSYFSFRTKEWLPLVSDVNILQQDRPKIVFVFSLMLLRLDSRMWVYPSCDLAWTTGASTSHGGGREVLVRTSRQGQFCVQGCSPLSGGERRLEETTARIAALQLDAWRQEQVAMAQVR